MQDYIYDEEKEIDFSIYDIEHKERDDLNTPKLKP